MNRYLIATSALGNRRLIVAAAALAATVFVVHISSTNAARSTGPVVSTAKTSLGRILVDAHGRTLYLFEKDRNGKSACSGKCAGFWPPVIATGKLRAEGGARASLVGTTRRADGRMQVTYNHHPLYRFAKDAKRGQTNGEGLDAFGAHWYVVAPAGSKIERNGSSSGAGGGYAGP